MALTEFTQINVLPRALSTKLRNRNVDLNLICKRYAFDSEKLFDSNARIPVMLALELIEKSRQVSGDYWAPMLWMNDIPTASFKGFSCIMELSGTLGKALTRLASMAGYVNCAVKVHIENYGENNEEEYACIIDFVESAPPLLRQTFSEGWIYQIVHKTWELMPSKWTPTKVTFQHEPQVPLYEYAKYFACPVEFEQKQNCFFISAKDWNLPTLQNDPHLADRIELSVTQHLQDSGVGPSPDLTSKVVGLVRAKLGQGELKIDDLARELGISARGLQRELSRRQTSFREIMAQARLELAKHYLKEKEMPLIEISFLLGYSNPSSFARAFRSQEGLSPKDFRQESIQ